MLESPRLPSPESSPRINRFLLPVVVFLTGAGVLIVEVLAVRVLSPYYGNTIFTVSSVISVVLLALSAGYYIGGVAADRAPSLHTFFGLIVASGVVLLLFYVAGMRLLPTLSRALSIETGPLASAALMFLLPALLLGTLSPYAVKLQSIYVPEQGVGRVAGTIFFWSTLGSITGSLLAGFVLIPNIGVGRVLIGVGVLLVLVGRVPLLVLGEKRARVYGVAAGAAALALGAPQFVAQPVASQETTIYRADGVYQLITIYEGHYLGRPARFLLLDRSESGAMFLDSDDPGDLVYDYTKYYSLYRIFTPRVNNALVLGGGAYSIPKALLRELPQATIDVAEIEPSFFDLAKRYFRATDSPRLHNHVEDGRRYLADAATQYDLIFGDVYYSYFSVPPQFTTKEFFTLARTRLRPEGVFIANMIGDLSRREPSLIMAEIKTFRAVFPNSYFFAVESAERTNQLQNITLVGFNSTRHMDVTAPPVVTNPDPLIRFLHYKTVDVDRRFELSPYPVLTDDFSPVEYLTARVLGHAFDAARDFDGDEMLAVRAQLLRYGARTAGTSGHVRDFLQAEMGGLAQELTVDSLGVTARFFMSEPRRRVLAAPSDDAGAVAVLVEMARALIASPLPPRFGVDIVFFDQDAAPPGATVLRDICAEGRTRTSCSATLLSAAAAKLRAILDTPPPAL
jgi:spermidine synthase